MRFYRPDANAFRTPIIVAGAPIATIARARFGSSSATIIDKKLYYYYDRSF